MLRTWPLAAALALTACGGDDPIAEDANTDALPAPRAANATDATGARPPDTPVNSDAPTMNAVEAAVPIPAAFHGRWGLVPDDCTSTRGDAKGLLTITARSVRFYESEAVPKANVESSADTFSADFAFSGEGTSWTRFQTLQLQGDALVRTESRPMASYTYARCD